MSQNNDYNEDEFNEFFLGEDYTPDGMFSTNEITGGSGFSSCNFTNSLTPMPLEESSSATVVPFNKKGLELDLIIGMFSDSRIWSVQVWSVPQDSPDSAALLPSDCHYGLTHEEAVKLQKQYKNSEIVVRMK